MSRSHDAPDAAQLVAGLADTLRPLDEALTLPRGVYTSAEIHAFEQRELFGRSWLCAGREEDVAEPGAFVTLEAAGERLLVLCGEDGALRAFFNVCRHRGARIVDEPCGRLRGAITCPYHAWTYGYDGRLQRVPRAEPGFAGEGLALVALPVATFGGFVFVNPGSAAAPLDDHLADLPDLAHYRLPDLRRAHRVEYEIAANWKIVCENYSECYHCPLVHPQLARVSDLAAGGFASGSGYNGGPMELRAGCTTLTLSGTSPWPRIDGALAGADRRVDYYLLYPNLMLGLHPDYVLTHAVWPLAPDRSRVVCEWLFPPGTMALPGFDPAPAVEFWDLTNRQDWELCERVQRGALSRGCRPGPYHPSERCVHAFDRWYAGWLSAAWGARAVS